MKLMTWMMCLLLFVGTIGCTSDKPADTDEQDNSSVEVEQGEEVDPNALTDETEEEAAEDETAEEETAEEETAEETSEESEETTEGDGN